MAGSAPTIPSLKQSFITTQTSLLSQALTPSRAWNASNDASEDALPERAVQEALTQLNHTVQQHCRRVYAPQANRNIAEQINSVYGKDAERKAGGANDADGGIGRELDFTDADAISALPPTWSPERDATNYPMEAKRYADAVQQLLKLSQQRGELKERIARLSRLQSVVEPLKTADGGTGVQENIITRNGEVEKELERMRFLLVRVSGRVGALPDPSPEERNQELDVTDSRLSRKRRVDEFLADPAVFPS